MEIVKLINTKCFFSNMLLSFFLSLLRFSSVDQKIISYDSVH